MSDVFKRVWQWLRRLLGGKPRQSTPPDDRYPLW
jgi:hypothetical protein